MSYPQYPQSFQQLEDESFVDFLIYITELTNLWKTLEIQGIRQFSCNSAVFM